MRINTIVSKMAKAALFLLGLFSLSVLSYSQSAPPRYVVVTFIKTDRGKASEYLEVMKKSNSKLWEARVKSGELDFFDLYSVNRMRTNPDDEYDFVGVLGAHSLKPLLDPAKTSREILKELMPAIDDHSLDLTLAEIPSLRVIYKQEVLKLLELVDGEGPKFYEVSYMRSSPGKSAAYEDLERNVFKPLHAERKSQGAITAWAFWQLTYPASGIRPYDYVTVNGINDWDNFINSDYSAIYKKVFPNGDINKVVKQIEAARTIVKTEVWKREVHVSADGK